MWMGGGEGGGNNSGKREGDWECSSCCNRNYAFRSFCNRCKQPRLLVDTKTPADSKWLPRIGDWICTGCTNNNYASREKCKKCGQLKEVAAMPAIAIPGASVPTHLTYFARGQGGAQQMVNVGSLQQSLSLSSCWSLERADKYGIRFADTYGVQSACALPLRSQIVSGFPFARQANQITPGSNGNGWRIGDWICTCGFHNYSSRIQCKKCDSPTTLVMPSLIDNGATGLGTKRFASEEIHNWDTKRLNAGRLYGMHQLYPGETMLSPGGNQLTIAFPANPGETSSVDLNMNVNLQLPGVPATIALLGKGAKQWRDGDWMCSNCNNHNYASRAQCNRGALAQWLSC